MAETPFSFLDRIVAHAEEERRLQRQKAAAERGVDVSVIIEEEKQEQERQRVEQERRNQEREAERAMLREKALVLRKDYGAKIGLSVPAHVGHIMRLAGLTENSGGNGMVSNTVWHVVVDGDMELGRLVRRKGDLLCKPAKRLGHRRSLGVSGTSSWDWDGIDDFGWESIEVNCSACKEILARLQKRGAK